MLSQELLDKDWGAKVPDYITKGTFSIAVFFMSLTMRGDWIMFLAHYWRSQETTLPAGHHHHYQLLVTLPPLLKNQLCIKIIVLYLG